MAVRYVLVDNNNQAILNDDGSLAIQTAEIIFTPEELSAHDTEILQNANVSGLETRISELVTLSEKQAEELKRIDIWNFIDSLTSDEEIRKVLSNTNYDIKDDIAVIKAKLESDYQDLMKLKPVNTGGVPTNKTDENKVIDTDNVFNK